MYRKLEIEKKSWWHLGYKLKTNFMLTKLIVFPRLVQFNDSHTSVAIRSRKLYNYKKDSSIKTDVDP